MPKSAERFSGVSANTFAMMLADARLPVGGHVSSSGLEPALNAGLHPQQALAYMLGRVATVSMVEAGVAVVARHLVGDADSTELGQRLQAVEDAWAARTPSQELRVVSRSLARGYIRLGLRLWPENLALRICNESKVGFSRPTVLGVIAAAAGFDAEGLVRLSIYDDAQTIAAALLKLEPLDPATPVAWVLEACESAEPLVPLIAAIISPDAIPATGAPQTEEWAEIHSTTTQRLFRA